MRSARNEGTVVVTGGNSGIGRALVTALLDEGYGVVACDISTDALDAIDHPRLAAHRVDVGSRRELQALFESDGLAKDIVGLVTCAAVFKRVGFLELTEDLWDETFRVNLSGTLYACQLVLPLLLAAGRGSIVLMSSSLARSGSPTGGHYAATKGAVLGLARSLALEVAERNVRVNVVSPGLTDTPQPRAHAGGAEAMAAKAGSIPLGRIGRPDDMAQAILFLLSDESSYVTGQDLRVNGGSQLF